MNADRSSLPEGSAVFRPRPPSILVVDDDHAVLEAVRAILRPQGYSVITAQSGLAAMRICQGHHGPIDLLITDVQMPGMSGLELATRVRAARPHIRVLLMSGAGVPDQGELLSGLLFIQKPLTPYELILKVQEALAPRG